MKNIIFILSLLLSFQAFAGIFDNPVKLENISNQMPKMGSIKCNFRQEKRMNNIPKPLVSGGEFEFLEGRGVYFYTKYPIESKTDYTNEKYKQINDIVNAVSSKKYSRLEKEFSFYYKGNMSDWSLGMKPKKNSNAYQFINSIVLSGVDYIKQIEIAQTNGNKTTIWFTK